MSSHQLTVPSSVSNTAPTLQTPIHASFSTNGDDLALLWESGYVELWDLHSRLEPGCGKIMAPTLTWSDNLKAGSRYIQIAVSTFTHRADDQNWAELHVLCSNRQGQDVLISLKLRFGKSATQDLSSLALSSRNGRLVSSDKEVVWQAIDGQIFKGTQNRNYPSAPILTPSLVTMQTELVSEKTSSFPEFCFTSMLTTVPSNLDESDGSLYIGLSKTGKLYISGVLGQSHALASNVNSFIIASGFLIFSTTAHEAHFAPLTTLSTEIIRLGEDDGTTGFPEWERRRVERGSRIVTAVPSTMSLVLQMPRGNLETINPRPLVMEIVKQDLDAYVFTLLQFFLVAHNIKCIV